MNATKLDAESTTLLGSCIQFDMFTDIFHIRISDIHTEHATLKKYAKCHLNARNLEIKS